MAPRNSPELAMLYDKEKQKGNANRSTPAALVQSAREFSDNAGGHGRS